MVFSTGLTSAPRFRPSSVGKGIMMGGAIGVAALTAMYIFVWRDPRPNLTHADVEAARRRWETDGPVSYSMHVVVTGGQEGEYDFDVQAGQVTNVTRNGRASSTPQPWWQHWTVPGMFDWIDRELEMSGAASQRGAGSARLRGEFDEKYGYPKRFERLGGGAQGGVQWEVSRFEPKSSG